jgi:HAD superfamily hydrolase (TIGR01450 family)
MGWVLDLDGVVWLAEEPLPGASEAVARLQAQTDVLFVTNNSSQPLSHYEAALERMGIEARGAVVSSAVAAASLVAPGERALLCAGPGVEEALEERGAEVVRTGDADVVVVGFHRDFDYERLRVASTAVRRGARLLATNDDATYPTPEGLIPGGGAILSAVVTASGTAPIIAGKPHAPMAAVVADRLGPSGVVVGDRPDTDGGFAATLGYEFVLVLSGVTTAEDLPVEPVPDRIAADLGRAVEDALGVV